MAHPLGLDAATTLRLPQALEEAETHYLRALKAALDRKDAVQVVAAPPNADAGAGRRALPRLKTAIGVSRPTARRAANARRAPCVLPDVASPY